MCLVVQLDAFASASLAKLTSYREIISTIAWCFGVTKSPQRRAPRKSGERLAIPSSGTLTSATLKEAMLSKSSTLTKGAILRDCNRTNIQAMFVGMYAFDQKQTGRTNQLCLDRRKSISFWIKSSARRAFGGCLGSKRR